MSVILPQMRVQRVDVAGIGKPPDVRLRPGVCAAAAAPPPVFVQAHRRRHCAGQRGDVKKPEIHVR